MIATLCSFHPINIAPSFQKVLSRVTTGYLEKKQIFGLNFDASGSLL